MHNMYRYVSMRERYCFYCVIHAQFLLLKYLLTCISITYGFLKSKKKKLNINEQNYLCLGELYMFMTI